MGVEVMAQDDECGREFTALDSLIRTAGPDEASGVREILRMLRDATDGAVDVHTGDPGVSPSTVARMMRFSAAISAALAEVTDA